jgi:hypothetical protein
MLEIAVMDITGFSIAKPTGYVRSFVIRITNTETMRIRAP